jgi:hypothetical protein
MSAHPREGAVLNCGIELYQIKAAPLRGTAALPARLALPIRDRPASERRHMHNRPFATE